MTKTDKSKHNICIAAIKRHTMKPYDFKWTKFYESNAEFPYTALPLQLAENELFICSTMIDADNYSILTTRRIITTEKGETNAGSIEGAAHETYGDFKGLRDKKPFTFGQILLYNGTNFKYFIETGKASMVMIHGIRTLIGTQQMTNTQMENLPKIWNKKSEQS
ncbi:hypothetical protein [Emticicia agri]|uniref:Uncharacterized protein n=1 Tax=Emticicia agri TaxID=2492393 RepID=A0A4V1ZCY2_9BACT|nr:hypothetical protein [Emticicia agri]RYU94250.1 hypothetical protein EWM59_17670 [Emticicia agri]